MAHRAAVPFADPTHEPETSSPTLALVPEPAAPEPAATRLVERPSTGRMFSVRRPVRYSHAERSGRLRLDALAGFVQDLAADDAQDSGVAEVGAWVVRRNVVEVHRAPVFPEELTLTAWFSGFGGRWAERRLSVTGDRGGAIEGVSLWVFIDTETLRPSALEERFLEVYGPSAGGRQVSSRLSHPRRWPDAACTWPWPLRAVDFDSYGHLNNTGGWAMAEEILHATDLPAPYRAEVEYRSPIGPDAEVQLHVLRDEGVSAWATSGDSTLHLTVRIDPLG